MKYPPPLRSHKHKQKEKEEEKEQEVTAAGSNVRFASVLRMATCVWTRTGRGQASGL